MNDISDVTAAPAGAQNAAASGEKLGIYAASRLAARISALIFREQINGDTGLNAHIEMLEDYPRTGKVIGLQVRSCGASAGNVLGGAERAARGYVCRGEMASAAYWFQHSLPVIVMVYEPENDRLVWESVSADTIEISGSRWELLVPYDKVFGADFPEYVADVPCYSPYLARMALDRPWMSLIESGRTLLLEADEWLNQPSEYGSARLSVLSESGGRESIYEWPFRTNPDMPHVFRLPSLFPWASIENDAAFWQQMNGTPPPSATIAPWTIEGGEIARFRMKLSLNELGRAFLVTEQFLRRGDFPAAAAAASGFGERYEDGLKFKLYKNRKA